MIRHVYSQDGTAIAYEKRGSGHPLILVDGALCDRSSGPNGPLAALLQAYYTVYTYDRRGRGDSGNAHSYAIEREIEDLSALIDEAGGTAYVYGISSGAALALEAANRLHSIEKLALYEAPYVVDSSRAPVPEDYAAQIQAQLIANRRGGAVKIFMHKGVGLPRFVVGMMTLMPAWSKLKAMAHTLPYDTLLTAEYQRGKMFPAHQWSNATQQVLVAVGGKSPVWMRNAMQALADTLPDASMRTVEGQTHIVKPEALVPVLREYYGN